MDSRIGLRHVRCFLAVSRLRSLARAADAIGLSQPAVTKTLQELERIVGAPLVERGRRGAVLTAAGESFLPHAAACLLELEKAVASVSLGRQRDRETVRLGALPTVAAEVVPAAIRRVKAEDPTADVQVVSGPNVFLLQRLRDERLDLVVGRLAAAELMANLSFVHLYSEPVRFVVRAGHPLLGAAPFDPLRLCELPVIVPDAEAVIRPSVERLLIALGIASLPNRIQSVSTSFGRAFVLDTDAVWIISEGVVARDLRSGDLVALPVDTRDTSGPVGLTTRLDPSPSPAVDRLFRAIRSVVAARAAAEGERSPPSTHPALHRTKAEPAAARPTGRSIRSGAKKALPPGRST